MLDNQFVQKSSSDFNSFDSLDLVQPNKTAISTNLYLNAESAISDFEKMDTEIFEDAQNTKVSLLLKNAETLLSHGESHLGLALLRQALNLDSWNPTVLMKIASVLEEQKKFSEAEVSYKALCRVEQSFETLYALATCLYKQSKDEAALEKYYEALALLVSDNQKVFDAYKNMGNILVRRGDFEGAEEFYNKAYTMNANSDVLLVNLGTLEVQRQDYEKAIYCFRKAVEINCDNDKAWVGLALVHNQYGDQELAWANVETAVELNPSNRTAVHVIGSWGMRDQKVGRAIPVLERYLSSLDFDEEMSLALIHLYCHQGMLEPAKIEIEKVLLWNPANIEVKNLKKQIKHFKKGAA